MFIRETSSRGKDKVEQRKDCSIVRRNDYSDHDIP